MTGMMNTEARVRQSLIKYAVSTNNSWPKAKKCSKPIAVSTLLR